MERVQLRSGREVLIREIRADDGDRLRAAYDRLSPESQYRRFFTPKPHLSTTETRYLVELDGRDHFALVATTASNPEEIIAVARFVRLRDDPEAAEPAIVVGDRFQGEGLASALLRRLADAAQGRGIARFRASVLATNTPARRLVRGLSVGRVHTHRAGPLEEIEIQLPPVTESDPAIIGSCLGGSRSGPERTSSALASRLWTRPSRRSKRAAANWWSRYRDERSTSS